MRRRRPQPRPRPLRGRCADVPPQDNRRDKAPAAELVALVGQGPGTGGVASRLSGDEIDRLASDPLDDLDGDEHYSTPNLPWEVRHRSNVKFSDRVIFSNVKHFRSQKRRPYSGVVLDHGGTPIYIPPV